MKLNCLYFYGKHLRCLSNNNPSVNYSGCNKSRLTSPLLSRKITSGVRKTVFGIALFIMSALMAKSQTIGQNPNEVLFNGYTIKLIHTKSGGYIYDVFLQNNIVIHRNTNPFTGSVEGLRNKEDALKLAKWETTRINPSTGKVFVSERKLPAEVATRLKINAN